MQLSYLLTEIHLTQNRLVSCRFQTPWSGSEMCASRIVRVRLWVNVIGCLCSTILIALYLPIAKISPAVP